MELHTLRHICVYTLIRHAIDWQPIRVAQHFETTFDSSYKAAGVLALKILSVLVPIIHHDMSGILKLFNPPSAPPTSRAMVSWLLVSINVYLSLMEPNRIVFSMKRHLTKCDVIIFESCHTVVYAVILWTIYSLCLFNQHTMFGTFNKFGPILDKRDTGPSYHVHP